MKLTPSSKDIISSAASAQPSKHVLKNKMEITIKNKHSYKASACILYRFLEFTRATFLFWKILLAIAILFYCCHSVAIYDAIFICMHSDKIFVLHYRAQMPAYGLVIIV